jgi:hypothetical protein
LGIKRDTFGYVNSKKGLLTLCKKVQTIEACYIGSWF